MAAAVGSDLAPLAASSVQVVVVVGCHVDPDRYHVISHEPIARRLLVVGRELYSCNHVLQMDWESCFMYLQYLCA